ncbi:hypothetical protein [Pandoraea sp. XY-2]|uniref:hypothetical protein n=1 Tax=Pandoraea sp. XY-2 TaxID=2518599 RepID=UPI0019821022|nr:hypothetical protein [Pandoraea sp. XY-2]
MPTLLFLAGLSDRVGHRVPLAIALLLGLAGTALTLHWPTLVALGGARACYGLATGLVAGSGTAYMTELYGTREDAATRGRRLSRRPHRWALALARSSPACASWRHRRRCRP